MEIQAGPHRVLAFITREAADQMGLEVGMHAIATVKAVREEHGVRSTVRLTRGRDIDAACGQLAAKA